MEQIELKGFPINIQFFIEEYDYLYNVRVNMLVKDRDDSLKEVLLTFTHNYFKEEFSRPEAVRHMLHYAMTHEIDECLYVNNDRVFDPHDSKNITTNFKD